MRPECKALQLRRVIYNKFTLSVDEGWKINEALGRKAGDVWRQGWVKCSGRVMERSSRQGVSREPEVGNACGSFGSYLLSFALAGPLCSQATL